MEIRTITQGQLNAYCGYVSPRQALQLGRLAVDRQAALEAAEEALAIEKPHMSDYF